ncbi:MAG: glycosyltransferase family 39 protein [Armatimonadia bacterium]
MKTRKALLLPLLAAAAAIAVPAAVYLGYLRLEVPRQHWFYFLPRGPRPGMIWPMLAVALMLGLLWAALRWRGKVEPWKVLAAAVVCCYLCAVGTRASTKMGFTTLASTVLFDGSNSYFTTATETPDPLALARDYPAQMPRLRLHAATQSPGTFLLHAGLRRFFLNCPSCMALAEVLLWLNPCHRASEVTALANPVWGSHFQPPEVLAALLIALLFPLILALGVVPTFALARRLGGERPALVIAALYAVTPSFIWFTSAVDQIYPTIAALTLLLVHCGVRHRTQWLPLLCAGLLTGLAIFASFGYSVIALAAALFIALLTSVG